MAVDRVRIGAIVAAAIVVLGLTTPATARPSVRVAWRAEPAAEHVAVDRSGRLYTVSTLWRSGRSSVELRAYRHGGGLRWHRVWRPAHASVSANAIATGPGGLVVVAGGIHRIDRCDEIWSWGWALRAWGADGRVRWQRAQSGWWTCDVFGTSGRAVAVAGHTIGVAIGYGSEYSANVTIAACGLDGRLRWVRDLRFANSDNEVVRDVAVGRRGAIYLAASIRVRAVDTPERDQDAVLVKLSPSGAPVWRRTAHEPTPGGVDDADAGTSVATGRGAVYFAAVLTQHGRQPEARLARYAPDGTLRWQRVLPGVSPRSETLWVGLARHGPVIAGAVRNEGGAGTHVTLRGFGSDGRPRWQMRIGPLQARSWSPIAFDVSDDRSVVAARPNVVWRWSRVWALA